MPEKLISELIDLPERVRKGDFVPQKERRASKRRRMSSAGAFLKLCTETSSKNRGSKT